MHDARIGDAAGATLRDRLRDHGKAERLGQLLAPGAHQYEGGSEQAGLRNELFGHDLVERDPYRRRIRARVRDAKQLGQRGPLRPSARLNTTSGRKCGNLLSSSGVASSSITSCPKLSIASRSAAIVSGES